jgi:processive 1,2-diacylglycerol beta-glucosyltransferase
LTTAEALAKRLPMVIVNPIPGQEMYNARFLLSNGAAVQAGSPAMVRQTVRDLLERPQQLAEMAQRAGALAHPEAAERIARYLLDLDQAQELEATRHEPTEPAGRRLSHAG